MKAKYSFSIMLAAVAMLVSNMPVHASEMDSRIELSARQSYVFKTFLNGEHIKIVSSDGAVTLTGTVSEESQKSLAQESVADIPGVKSVYNGLKVKGAAPGSGSEGCGCDAPR